MAWTAESVDDATLALLVAPGLGSRTAWRLLEAMGSPRAILEARGSDLMQATGADGRRVEAWRRSLERVNTAAERRRMARVGARLLVRGEAGYPALLATIPDPPLGLWVRGSPPALDGPAVAIVGARRCTAYGRDQAARFASALADAGLVVVSGGARGIDAVAHRAALRVEGRTVAVLGCGLGHCYPHDHDRLFDAIATRGCVASEFPLDQPPRPGLFPRRNRIVSGLSLGVLVVEAARRSGALITARLAVEEHHRAAMAVPGPVGAPSSAGCHAAIRGGWSALVTDPADVAEELRAVRPLLGGAGDDRREAMSDRQEHGDDGGPDPGGHGVLGAGDDRGEARRDRQEKGEDGWRT